MKRPVFLSLGFLFLAIGAIGVPLPILPTTPFVLLAAYCFSRSSERFHQMLLNHRIFGKLVRDWEAYRVIPLRAKILATTMMLLMISYPLFFKQLPVWAVVFTLITVVTALLYIWTKASKVPED